MLWQVLSIALLEFIFAIFLISSLGLIWAVAQPAWLEALIGRAAVKTMLVTLGAILIVLVAWMSL